MNWAGKRVLVTGGHGFIGSHLANELMRVGATVDIWGLEEGDLREASTATMAVEGYNYVFHLAADLRWESEHNFLLDQQVFKAALESNVQKVIYASSAAVYPNFLQQEPDEELYLQECQVGPPYDPSGMYGLSKLVGERTLQTLYREHGLKSACCRLFPVYGPQCSESLAIGALVGRAFRRENPFQVWGDGSQVRGWTYVSDIVAGLILAAEKVDDATAVNLGTQERITVRSAAYAVLNEVGLKSPVQFLPEKAFGPLNMVADNSRAKELLGWEPQVSFLDGIRETVDWFRKNYERSA